MRIATVLLFFALVGCSDGLVSTSPTLSQAAPRRAGIGSDEAAVRFPQAFAGALWANPDIYPSIPLRIAAPADATLVTVELAGSGPIKADGVAPGLYRVDLAIAGLQPGIHSLAARVETPAGVHSASAELGIGSEGVQLTDWNFVGRASTPRLHTVEGHLYVTWTDRREGGISEAWLREIDGAGRWLGSRVRLGGSPDETLAARVAIGNGRAAVLFQDMIGGLPYNNRLQIVDLTGVRLHGPTVLEPAGLYGTRGGDIEFDGEAFVLTYRLSAGAGKGEVRWLRVNAETFAVTGPVAVGIGTEEEPFALNSPVTVEVVGGVSMVSYVRTKWSSPAGMAIPRAHFAYVSKSGQVLSTTIAGSNTLWNEQAAVFRAGGAFLAHWSSTDLNDSSDNPPTRLHGKKVSSQETVSGGALVVQAPMHRSELAVVEHPAHFATAAWLDQRSKAESPLHGKIQLYAARLGSNLALTAPVVFDHAWFVEGTSQLAAVRAGDNVLLSWLDERHGGGVFDPKPEVYFETVWY